MHRRRCDGHRARIGRSGASGHRLRRSPASNAEDGEEKEGEGPRCAHSLAILPHQRGIGNQAVELDTRKDMAVRLEANASACGELQIVLPRRVSLRPRKSNQRVAGVES